MCLTLQWIHAKKMTWMFTSEGLLLLPFVAGC